MKLLISVSDTLDDKNFVEKFYSSKRANFSTDSGLDLVIPNELVVPAKSHGFKIKLGIHCEAIFEDRKPRGYFIYSRSSTGSKTPLRLSNSVGIIDYTYRGEIMACVDNISDMDFTIEKGQRLFQLCSPDLSPVYIEVTSILSSTERQSGGYGSTGI